MPGLSLAGRLANVIASPGDAFEDIKGAPPNHKNWLAPAFLLVLTGWIGTWLVLAQPAVQQQLSDLSTAAIDKQLEQGRLSEAQAQQAREMAEKIGTLGPKIGAYAAPVVVGFGLPFIWGLILWIIGRHAFKTNLPYLKAVEVAGLGNVIAVLETVLKTPLIIVTGNLFVVPGPALLVSDFNPQTSSVHALLAALNVMVFWVLAVRAVGLSRLTNVSFARAALWVFGVWGAYTGFFLGLGLAMKAVFKV